MIRPVGADVGEEQHLLSSFDESSTMQGIVPHGFEDAVDVTSAKP